MKTVDTGHDDLKEDEDEPGPRSSQSEAESDIYDDILPAEVCRCKMPLKYCMNILKDESQWKGFLSCILL